MSSFPPTLTRPAPQTRHRVLALLSDTFGHDFAVWRRSPAGWSPELPAGPVGPMEEMRLVRALLNDGTWNGGPSVRMIVRGQCAVLLPVDPEDPHRTAAAIIHTEDTGLLLRLTASAARLIQQELRLSIVEPTRQPPAEPLTGERLTRWLLALERAYGPAGGDAPRGGASRERDRDHGNGHPHRGPGADEPHAVDATDGARMRDRGNVVIRLMRAMSSAIDARDTYTRGHSRRVGRYARGIGRQLQLASEECDRLYLTGLLHDIGKIGVPDRVLLKAGRLSDDEFDLIKQHPEIGYRILEPIAELAFALPGVLHHHERIDGQGYPHRLRGDEIPFSARILAVADAYDAMTSSRTYRTAMSTERAQGVLADGAGQQWDRPIVAAFLRMLKDAAAAQAAQDATKDSLGDSTDFFVLAGDASVLEADAEESPAHWQTGSMIVPKSKQHQAG